MPVSYADTHTSGLDSVGTTLLLYCFHGAFESELLQSTWLAEGKSSRNRLIHCHLQKVFGNRE